MQGGQQAEGHLVVGEEDGGDVLARRGSGRPAPGRRRSPTTASSPRAGAPAPGTRRRRSSERQPPMRPRASCESAGPATWCTVRWPRSSRWRVASRAPVSWSTPTAGRSSPPPTWTATSGTGASIALQRLGGVVVGAQRDDGVDRLGHEAVHGLPHRPRGGVVQDRDAERVAGRAGGLLQPEHRLRRAVLVDLDRDQPDRPGRPGDQRPRRDVRPVAQLGDRLLDALTGQRRDAGVPVDHPGHRLVGDPGSRGHVRHHQRRGTAPPRAALLLLVTVGRRAPRLRRPVRRSAGRAGATLVVDVERDGQQQHEALDDRLDRTGRRP